MSKLFCVFFCFFFSAQAFAEDQAIAKLFALNMDIRNEKELPLRLKLTKEALQAKGVIK